MHDKPQYLEVCIYFTLKKALGFRVYCYSTFLYEGWNFNSGNYLFTTDTK